MRSELLSLKNALMNGEVSVVSQVERSLSLAEQKSEIGAFLTLCKTEALERAEKLDSLNLAERKSKALFGIPIAIKDNISTAGIKTTCGSKMLENYTPVFNASIIEKLLDAGCVIIGKTNMDEFAMGSSTEYSAFIKTRNPIDPSKVPGGSSGGSAAAVSSDIVPISLGSDTGGSIRQPAAFCGIVGYKPSYGLVSRYGLVAFASSLDQIGPLGKTVRDCAAVADVIVGYDKFDSTSYMAGNYSLEEACNGDPHRLTYGVIKELLTNCSAEITDPICDIVEKLVEKGHQVKEISIRNISQSLNAYYVIAPAEASSNLARFDGIRYGLRKSSSNTKNTMIESRTEGFGPEVKRRIMLGTYALSSGYYDAYYKKAAQFRRMLIQEFENVFKEVDILISPTTPTTAFKLGQKLSDPYEMYLSDAMTIPANLVGVPALSLPISKDSSGMPIGLQLMSKLFNDEELFLAASEIEELSSAS